LKFTPQLPRVLWAVPVTASLALALNAPPLAAQIPSAAALSAEIDTKGAKEVVNRLNSSPAAANGRNDWDRVTNQIWIGRSAYIRLARRLAQGTDAGTSEDLGISLAHALPLAPVAVLRVTDLGDRSTLGVSRICGVPFIEGTIKGLPAYIRAAQASVGRVAAPELQEVKGACLKELDAAARPSLSPEKK
jgi:hypothetical protein